ncbi:hypothetical protein DH2020_044015 [Rehmannia glutinosa]|uniref:Uncharacterized protein n=1 Tax=Rehmannia glutinosa TaxID=99300 RepID=A0ABR0UIH6_REHGL
MENSLSEAVNGRVVAVVAIRKICGVGIRREKITETEKTTSRTISHVRDDAFEETFPFSIELHALEEESAKEKKKYSAREEPIIPTNSIVLAEFDFDKLARPDPARFPGMASTVQDLTTATPNPVVCNPMVNPVVPWIVANTTVNVSTRHKRFQMVVGRQLPYPLGSSKQ